MICRILAVSLCLLPHCSGLLAQERSHSVHKWVLVWSDEFNGLRVDTSKWNLLLRENSKHNELQYYVPDEVFVEQGSLRIRSRVRSFGSKRYTSGRLDTRGKFAAVYGFLTAPKFL